ncbi:MAG: RNA-protein complex protein Nop10 [Candidatus Bathyarchaeota archaeon]|nr:MAG: RNA-protein complex protein Nop10 [Candidatus Bathyarchaeota archaeon]
MVWLLRKCVECERYTLNKNACPHCGGRIRIPHPAKFSPNDKYARYRIALKEGKLNENDD